MQSRHYVLRLPLTAFNFVSTYSIVTTLNKDYALISFPTNRWSIIGLTIAGHPPLTVGNVPSGRVDSTWQPGLPGPGERDLLARQKCHAAEHETV